MYLPNVQYSRRQRYTVDKLFHQTLSSSSGVAHNWSFTYEYFISVTQFQAVIHVPNNLQEYFINRDLQPTNFRQAITRC